MRKSKVITISLPQVLDDQLTKVMQQSHQHRSEVMKNALHNYLTSTTSSSDRTQEVPQLSLSYALKLYWDLFCKQSRETIVVALAIISKDNTVLIGRRASEDPYVKQLTWVFPGSKVLSLNFSKELQSIVKAETGLQVSVGKLVHARLHPDNLSQEVDIVALYFHCQVIGGKEKPGQYKQQIPLVELKWVPPTQVFRYFTTSTADEVVRFLKLIELKA